MVASVFDSISVEEMTGNILASHAAADADCLATGTDWYPRANRFIVDLASITGLSVERIAAIVAVLSPRSSWATNKVNAAAVLVEAGHVTVDAAVDILQRYAGEVDTGDPRTWPVWRLETPKGLPGPIAKARAIADGGDPAYHIGHGSKTLSFWDNLVHPVLSTEVTVDAWAAGAALGRRLSNAEMASLKPHRYAKVAAAYRAAAAALGIAAHTLQAIVWCEFRGRTGWGADRHQ